MQIAVAIVFLLSSPSLLAWGQKGQKITALIAQDFLRPSVAVRVTEVLNGDSLATVATWADAVRNNPDWRHTSVWHYTNLPDPAASERKGIDPGDVVEAIDFCIQKLQDTGTPPSEQTAYLKLLVHLLGDIHQPLHVGRAEDRGGNLSNVRYKGRELSLHKLWDSAIIDSLSLNEAAYKARLIGQNRGDEASRKRFDSDDVVRECLSMRRAVYSFSRSEINDQYVSMATKVIDGQLWLGGLRLASILNSIYGQ